MARLIDDYIFIDTETTCLPGPNDEPQLLELTYAVGDNEPITLYPEIVAGDLLEYADPAALEVNKFIDRFRSDDEFGEWVNVPPGFHDERHLHDSGGRYYRQWMKLPEPATDKDWDAFVKAVEGRTWVGANPHFDFTIMQDFYTPEYLRPHHRLFDIQAFVAGYEHGRSYEYVFEPVFDKGLPSMATIAGTYSKVRPDHTSLNDVLALREAFKTITRL